MSKLYGFAFVHLTLVPASVLLYVIAYQSPHWNELLVFWDINYQ